jgi:hypothetical protein
LPTNPGLKHRAKFSRRYASSKSNRPETSHAMNRAP